MIPLASPEQEAKVSRSIVDLNFSLYAEE